MPRSFPPDVIVLDTDSLLHARLARGRKEPRLTHGKSYRLADDTFVPAVVTPELAREASLAEALRRVRLETGRWENVSLLLPDSWFRINLIDLPSLPDREPEALEIVRWSLKRTLPIAPEDLRVAWHVLARTPSNVKLLVVSAVDKTLSAIERTFTGAGMNVVLIEPLGLNLWNAITVREGATAGDRLFVYVREREFTTAVFRGAQPLFIRSRNLSEERTLLQEIRLSASYLRDTLRSDGFENCYLAGANGDVAATLAAEFSSTVRAVALRDFVEQVPAELSGGEAELTACTGVFTG